MPDGLFKGSMRKGISRELPKRQDWKALLTEVMRAPGSEYGCLVTALRTSLLARWMEDDAEAAVNWFRSPEGEAISVEVGEKFVDEGFVKPFGSDERRRVKVSREVSLAAAARHWIARNQGGAFEWIREHPEVLPDILKGGNWLDEDRVSSSDLRLMIAHCLNDSEREELLRSPMGRRSLSRLLDQDEEAALRDQIAELKLTEEFMKELLEGHLRKRFTNEVNPFSDDPDPFGE